MYLTLRRLLALSLLCMLMIGCASSVNGIASGTSTPTATRTQPTPAATFTPAPFPTDISLQDSCPPSLAFMANCQTPQSMRTAYGLNPLLQKGYTGKGQTVVDIVSFGSPTLQKDVDTFDRQFGLPAITIQQISPLNEPESDPHNDRSGWVAETTLDVEIIHALAPGANIVVLISPVAETEGTAGLPEFRQLLQYTIDHKLGDIISQSWGASEITLKDAAGQTEIKAWDTLYKQATTQDGLTIFSSSGDNGATDYEDAAATRLSPTPTTSFPADDPWVTSVGGTTLNRNGTTFAEAAWNMSGGGFSSFFPAPTYQKTLSDSVQTLSQNRRGVPDVSGNADPTTGLAMYANGSWSTAGGTSASAPLWAALGAIADQMAGHPLGFLNTALYQIEGSARYTQDFHDITVGNNSIHSGGVNVEGYNAVPGWDAITGLGSPNAANLLPDVIATLNEQG
jgi:subtilase family serine protease